jgi:GT2 family glycosyltransferase
VPKAEIVHYGGVSTKQIPARSIVSLWRSRAYLYHRHHGRLKFSLARRIVKSGMRRKATHARSQDLQTAYLEAAAIWQNTFGS